MSYYGIRVDARAGLLARDYDVILMGWTPGSAF